MAARSARDARNARRGGATGSTRHGRPCTSSRSRRRRRDNVIALIVLLVVVALAITAQILYFTGGPGKPVAEAVGIRLRDGLTARRRRPRPCRRRRCRGNRTWTGTLTLNTTKLGISLDGKAAPQAVANFVSLAQRASTTGLTCHRLTDEAASTCCSAATRTATARRPRLQLRPDRERAEGRRVPGGHDRHGATPRQRVQPGQPVLHRLQGHDHPADPPAATPSSARHERPRRRSNPAITTRASSAAGQRRRRRRTDGDDDHHRPHRALTGARRRRSARAIGWSRAEHRDDFGSGDHDRRRDDAAWPTTNRRPWGRVDETAPCSCASATASGGRRVPRRHARGGARLLRAQVHRARRPGDPARAARPPRRSARRRREGGQADLGGAGRTRTPSATSRRSGAGSTRSAAPSRN